MKKDSILAKKQGISFFDKNLPIWVLICMALGIAIGQYFPEFAVRLEKLQILNTSIPIAVLTWIMIFPMMLKIDLKAILNVRKNYKGVVISSFTSWAVKPFLMFGLASFFFYVVFKSFIPIELAQSYVAGAVLLGAGHAQQWSSYGVRSQRVTQHIL